MTDKNKPKKCLFLLAEKDKIQHSGTPKTSKKLYILIRVGISKKSTEKPLSK